jgi:hypothetical protein
MKIFGKIKDSEPLPLIAIPDKNNKAGLILFIVVWAMFIFAILWACIDPHGRITNELFG